MKCPKVTKSCVMLSAFLSKINALVPDAPQVNLIPAYSSESQALTSLMIEIRSQMVRVCLKEFFNINLSVTYNYYYYAESLFNL